MDEFFLCNFNSFFELMVAFTFAYNGSPHFREFINKVSTHRLNSEVTRKYKEQLEDIASQMILFAGADDQAQKHYTKKLEKVKTYVNEMDAISQSANDIYEGRPFKHIFMLAGSVYIFFIIICGFHPILNNTAEYLIILLLSFLSSIVYIKTIRFIRRASKGKKPRPTFLEENTAAMLACVFWTTLVISIIIFLTSFILEDFLIRKFYADISVSWANWMPITWLDVFKMIVVIAVISVSLIPFGVFYLRRWLFFGHHNTRWDSAEKSAASLIEDIQMAQRTNAPFKTNSEPSTFLQSAIAKNDPNKN